MAIVITKGGDSSIQKMNVGRICYGKVEMKQAFLNGKQIWPDSAQYVKNVKLTPANADSYRKWQRVMYRLPKVTTSSTNCAYAQLADRQIAMVKAYNSLPLMTYNATSGLWEFGSGVNVPLGAFVGMTQITMTIKIAAFDIATANGVQNSFMTTWYSAKQNIAGCPLISTDKVTAYAPAYSFQGMAQYCRAWVQEYDGDGFHSSVLQYDSGASKTATVNVSNASVSNLMGDELKYGIGGVEINASGGSGTYIKLSQPALSTTATFTINNITIR